LAFRIISGPADQEADTSRVVELLRVHSERPNRRTAEEGDELAPVHRGISCRQARVFVEQRSTPRARC
jgi:hypothetical protein